MSKFASDIREHKYSHDLQEEGRKENWGETSLRVSKEVLRSVHAPNSLIQEVANAIAAQKFIPGGRYLYATGRPFHQVNNCLMLRAEDSREGWADLMHKITLALMTGAGLGVDYSDVRHKGAKIRRTGGTSTGPIALMQMVNEAGRGIMQGGSRRSALWAGLRWDHNDIFRFIHLKDWSPEVCALKVADYNFPAAMDGTNISVLLNDEFFKAFHNENHPKHSLAHNVYWETIRQMLKTGEPGLSVNLGACSHETLRNACQPSYATVLTPNGISTIGEINVGDTIWSGSRWTTVLRKWATGVKPVYRYQTTTGHFIGTEDHRIVSGGYKVEVSQAETIDYSTGPKATASNLDPQDIMDGLVLGDGSVHRASNNLVYLMIGHKDGDYFESEIAHLITKGRPGLSPTAHEIKTTITASELPKTFQRTVPDRFYYGDHKKKMGFLRGLFTANGSINGNRVCLKQSSKVLISEVQEMLSSLGIHSYITTNKGHSIEFSNGRYECKESYDLNITSGRTIFRDCIGFIQSYKQEKIEPGSVPKYLTSAIKSIEFMEETEVFDIMVEASEHTYWTGGCLVSNCCELVSEDDSDVCNLGSINLANIESLEEMERITEIATAFLLAGTVYSDVPYPKVDQVRTKNRRLGLGLMGVHEFLLLRGKKYGPDAELDKYLEVYAKSTEIARKYADGWELTHPIKTRAIAPTGTISIIAETTGGIEPMLCAAYKRRYLKGDTWHYQYVIDPAAKRLIDRGVKPEHIEDAYDLAKDPERRVVFQTHLQKYVDHAISSTINLPPWGSEDNNESHIIPFGEMLIKYLPQMRGITTYPDGARGGQPINPVKIQTALKHINKEFQENGDSDVSFETGNVCELTGGGVCGS